MPRPALIISENARNRNKDDYLLQPEEKYPDLDPYLDNGDRSDV